MSHHDAKNTGWLNINKPIDLTSCTVVNILKRRFDLKKHKIKIGHAGTLDPMATGVLPIALGRENTKMIDILMNAEKEYDFTIQFGIQTCSGDITGKVIENHDLDSSAISLDKVKEVIKEFIGEIEQTPSKYSAIKINGVRAYDLARSNIDFQMKKRKISIYHLEVLNVDSDLKQASLLVTCSKGTYVRSLGEDISVKLGTIGTLIQLNRRRVGSFNQSSSINPFEATIENLLQI